MHNKTCFITGANSGIGKQAAIQLAQLGFHVFVGARNSQRGKAAVEEIKNEVNTKLVDLIIIDLASKDSIAEGARQVIKLTSHLDVLIHNAADFNIAQKDTRQSPDGIETIWATNHLGPIRLTNVLMPLIEKSEQGRIITIASQGLMMHPFLKVDLDDPEFKKRKFTVPRAYYQSKIAQVMYTYWLAEELRNTPITVNCIRVSNVQVDMDRYPNVSPILKKLYGIKMRFAITAEKMAETYTYLTTSPELRNTTGKYFNEKNQEVRSSKYSQKQENIDAVMELSNSYLP